VNCSLTPLELELSNLEEKQENLEMSSGDKKPLKTEPVTKIADVAVKLDHLTYKSEAAGNNTIVGSGHGTWKTSR
jgi:hypothetical protein